MVVQRHELKEWARDALVGVIDDPPLAITPDMTLDVAGITHNVETLIAEGATGIAIGGNIGEGWNLGFDSWSSMHEVYARAAQGRVQLWTIILEANPAQAVQKLKAAADAGFTGAEIMPPFPTLRSDHMIRDYFELIAGATDLPLVLYRTPTAGPLWSVELTKLVAELDTVVGIKQGSQIMGDTQRLRRRVPELVVMEATERFLLYDVHAGGPAVMFASPAFGLFGRQRSHILSYLAAAAKQDWDVAWTDWRVLTPVAGVYQDEINERIAKEQSYIGALPALKAWYELVGLAAGPPLPPVSAASTEEQAVLEAKLRDAGVI